MNLNFTLHYISKAFSRCCVVSASLLMLFLLCPNANADLIINVQDTTIAAGGPGYVDVLISSDIGTDVLTYASYDFNITGGVGSTLEFTDPQDHDFENAATDYVFAGVHDGIVEYGPTNSQLVADDGGPGTTLSSQLLLVRLDLTHVLGPGQLAADAAGEQFQITLDELSPDTLFLDENNIPLTIDGLNSHLTATITVTSAAVPEPATFALLAVGGLAMGYRNLRRKKSGSCAAASERESD